MYDPKRHVSTQVSARNAILCCFTSDQIKRLAGDGLRVSTRLMHQSRNSMEDLIHDNWRAIEPAIKAEFEIVWKRAA